MRKFKILSFPLIFLFVSIAFSFKSNVTSSNPFVISQNEVGPIRMGYTTIEEARDSLGITNPIESDEYEGVHRVSPGHCMKGVFYEYRLVDSTKGIIVNAQCENLHVVYQIWLAAPCKWKTADGFGIGSSFEEIKKKMGTPDYEMDTTDILTNNHGYSNNHDMKYGNIDFYSHHTMDEPGGCCVDVITITCDKITRANAGVAFKAKRKAKCPHPCAKC